MANILALLHNDGSSGITTEIRNGVEQQVIKVDLTYDNVGGSGLAEFILRNTTSDNNAEDVTVAIPTKPTDPQKKGELDQSWDYKPLGSENWRNLWQDTIIIPRIPPGGFINVRTRVLATATSEPTTHQGAILITYLRASV